MALKWEREAFSSGKWKPWEKFDLQSALPGGHGWCRDVRWVARNWLYAVLVRPVETDWGLVYHLAIRTASNLEPPWRDKQRIKDELFSPEHTAVEVMPPRSELIDEADMYHVWVLPPSFQMPFTIFNRLAMAI